MNTSTPPSSRPGRRLQRFLIIAIALVGLGGAWVYWQTRLANRLDREKAFIESRQGTVYFSDQIDDVGDIIEAPIQRNWIAHLSRTPLNINLHKVQRVRECLEIAAHYQGLWQIDLSESDIANSDLDLLSQMTSLRHLFLNDTQIGDAALPVLSQFQDLETLDLSRTKVTADGLAKWRPPKTLKTLVLIECDVAEGSLLGLANHSKLETLRLCDTKAASSLLTPLGYLPKLDELDLSGTLVDGAIVPWLREQFALKTLKLADSKFSPEDVNLLTEQLIKLSEVDLSRLPITDKSIRNLSRGRRLRTISLSGAPFEDEMTPFLFEMVALQELYLDETKMTAEGIVRLVEKTRLVRLGVSAKVLSDADRQYIATRRPDLELLEIPAAAAP